MFDDDKEPVSESLDYLPPDHFYHGVIQKLFHGKQGGVVRSNASGREIPFTLIHVTLLGGLHRFEDLREGMPIGYDVGWTSRGLRVTVIRPRE